MDQEGVDNANEASNNNSTEPELPGSQIFEERRNPMWKEFIRIAPESTTDGKERALCKHCKRATFVSNSHYGMTNMRKHLTKCIGALEELHCCPIPEEWEMLEQIRDVLEPFNEITELFSGSDYPTSNLYFSNVWRILMLLNELKSSNDELLKAMATEMKCKFDKYWFNSEEDNYGMLFAFAVILDPRCKLPVLRFCYEQLYGSVDAAWRITDIQLKLERFYKDYDSSMPTLNINISTTSTSFGNHKHKFDYFVGYFDCAHHNCCFGINI